MTNLTVTLIRFLFVCVLHNVDADTCEEKCTKSLLLNFSHRYEDCMTDCKSLVVGAGFKNWPLDYYTDCAEPKIEDNANPVCSPDSVEVLSVTYPTETSLRDNSGSANLVIKNKEYFAVTWTPCRVGISDIKGFRITVRNSHENGLNYCIQSLLNRGLSIDDIHFNFSVPSLIPFEYSKKYTIEVESLPMTLSRYHTYIDYESRDCLKENLNNECVCGFSDLPQSYFEQPSVTTKDYVVSVIIPHFKPCFGVQSIEIYLKIYAEPVYLRSIEILAKDINDTSMVYNFFNIFPVPVDMKIEVVYIVFGLSDDGNHLPRRGKTTELVSPMVEHTPEILSIVVDKTVVNVNFSCVANIQNIFLYNLKLSHHDSDDHEKILMKKVMNFSCENNFGNGQFIITNSGLYSVQVREQRPPKPFLQQAWSKVSGQTMFIVNVPEDLSIFVNVVIPIVGIVLIGTLAIGIWAMAMYCWKCSSCIVIKRRLPNIMSSYLEKHSSFLNVSHKEKCVWLVWQADDKSKEIGNVNAENIRLLAAYLTIHCGLKVELDLFSANTSANFCTWMSEMQNKADTVIFVIPYEKARETYKDDDIRLSSHGNFDFVFKYLEKDIYQNATQNPDVKFVSVLLPYSKASSSEISKSLVKTTKVFRLMDEIEELYFYIQGQRNVSIFGRTVVQGVNGADFALTVEGKKLQHGIVKMNTLLKNYSNNCKYIEDNLNGILDQQDECICTCNTSDATTNSLLPPEDLTKMKVQFTPTVSPVPPPDINDIEIEDTETSILLINSNNHLQNSNNVDIV